MGIPDANVAGRGDPSNGNLLVPDGFNNTNGAKTPGVSLVGRLDIAIGRNSTSRSSGNTTTGDQQLNGLLTYLGSARVGAAGDVTISQQGINGSAKVGPVAGITATGQGANVTADFIFSELAAFHSVKLGMSGHAVDVIAAGSVLGADWIAYQSDLQQTPVDLNDANLGGNPTFAWLVPVAGSLELRGEVGTPLALNDITIGVVPEPSCAVLLAVAAALLAARRYRRRASEP